MRALLASLMMLCAASASAQQRAPYPLVWRSEAAVLHGGELMRVDGAFHIASSSSGISNLTSGARTTFPNLPHMIFADERRYVGLVQPESHYFSNGTHGRLVAGELGSNGVRRLRGLGEVRPVAALHNQARLLVAYIRDDESQLRIAAFADGAERGAISARLPIGTDYPAAHHLSLVNGRVRLLSAGMDSSGACNMPLSLVTLAAETLAQQEALTGCAQGAGKATIHDAGDGTWFLIGGARTSAMAWRVRVADGALVAEELWRDESFQGWSALSTVDEASGDLFVTAARGPAGDLEVIRISRDGATRTDHLTFTCPSAASRYSALLSASGPAHVLARVGSCAHLWRLG